MRRLTVLFLTGLVCVPRTVMACATCYGTADAPQTHAMNMAILTLIGFIGTVLSLLTIFFVYLQFRAKIMATEAAETGEVRRFMEVNANE